MEDKNQIIIDTNKYFLEVVDEGGGTIGYTVVHPEKLLREIIKQNKQLTSKIQEYELLVRTNKIHIDTLSQLNDGYINLKQECEALKSESFTREELISMQEKDVARYLKALEEIEEYIYNNTDFDINDSIQSKTAGYDILQIIKDV